MCSTSLEREFHSVTDFTLRTEYIVILKDGWGTRWRSLVEALRYKPEGRRFVSDGVIGIFHFFPAALRPWG
jgi:hypothetical protein